MTLHSIDVLRTYQQDRYAEIERILGSRPARRPVARRGRGMRALVARVRGPGRLRPAPVT